MVLIESACSRVVAMQIQTLAVLQVGSGGKEADSDAKAQSKARQGDPAPPNTLDRMLEASEEAVSSRRSPDLAVVMATSEVYCSTAPAELRLRPQLTYSMSCSSHVPPQLVRRRS